MTVSQLQGKLGKQLTSFNNRWRFLLSRLSSLSTISVVSSAYLLNIQNSLDVEQLKDCYIHHGAFLWDPSLLCLFLHLCLYSHVTSSRRPVLRLFLNGNSLSLIQYSAFSSVQFSSIQSHARHARPGLPVHHQLPEFTQTHVHQVGDAIQPSHPLSSPSPPAPNPSQHQSLFQ